jgi:hypothetical protein
MAAKRQQQQTQSKGRKVAEKDKAAKPVQAAERRRTAAPPRWPAVLMLLAGLLSLGGMVYARESVGKNFIMGLVVVGMGVGLMVGALVARAVGHNLWKPGVLGPVSALLAAAAAGARVYLLSTVPKKVEGPLPVVMTREILIGVPVTLAAFALVLATWAVYRTLSLQPGELSHPGRKNDIIAGIIALAAALYTLAPLLSSFGIPLNHWTFLGLVALGLVAFILATVYEKIFG